MIKTLVKFALFLVVLGAIGGLAYGPAMKYWKDRNKPNWVTAKVIRGDAVREINSTGKVRPVLSVSVVSFVSGPIV